MKKITFLLPFIIGSILFFGGGLPGISREIVYVLGIFSGILLISISLYLKGKKLALPKGWIVYLLFLLVFSASIFWSLHKQISLGYLSLFISGGLFWLAVFNLKEELSQSFLDVIVFVGLLFLIIFLFLWFNGNTTFLTWSLVYPSTVNHHHLGDYWVLVMLVVTWWMTRKTQWWYFILILAGIGVLIISFSRSAFLALFIGLLFLIKEKLIPNKKIYYLALAFPLILFFLAGSTKSVFFSRPYFVQGALGIFHNPLGVGVGNFAEISADKANQVFGLSSFSSYAHNIVLEILAGMGVLGLIFVYWLVKILVPVFKRGIGDKDYLIYKVLFLALTVNFLFDFTYIIPSMLWLWFFLLAFV